MTVNDNIQQYLHGGMVHRKDIQTALDLSLHLEFIHDVNKSELHKINSTHAFISRIECSKIFNKFNSANINYIYFKGNVLATLLYEHVNYRLTGDIDIYVTAEDFEQALSILYSLGYRLRYPNALLGEHHVSLENNKTVVELHKHIINPRIGINETYLLNHIRSLDVFSCNVKTFDATATFLHLLFHLYMDYWLSHNSMYNIFVSSNIPRTNRFLYRAYEISLYSEKYYKEINWKEIVHDITNQKLRVIFKKMLLDIIAIFPGIFPCEVLEKLLYHRYCEDKRDTFYEYLIDNNIYKETKENFACELCDFVNENWNKRESNICTTKGEKIFLSKNYAGADRLTCEIQVAKTSNGISLTFEVSVDDLCISEVNTLDEQSSDGIHLILCGTENKIYSYNSIFFFPKMVDDKESVIVCDILSSHHKIIDKCSIQADFELREDTYIITALLSNEYVSKNNLSTCFYMGVVVSDCSNETKRRKNRLVLSEDETQWYNPIYFARVDVD